MNHQKVKNYLQGNGTNWILWYKKLPGPSYIENVWNTKFEQQEVSLKDC